jgi:hypothetical protein
VLVWIRLGVFIVTSELGFEGLLLVVVDFVHGWSGVSPPRQMPNIGRDPALPVPSIFDIGGLAAIQLELEHVQRRRAQSPRPRARRRAAQILINVGSSYGGGRPRPMHGPSGRLLLYDRPHVRNFTLVQALPKIPTAMSFRFLPFSSGAASKQGILARLVHICDSFYPGPELFLTHTSWRLRLLGSSESHKIYHFISLISKLLHHLSHSTRVPLSAVLGTT